LKFQPVDREKFNNNTFFATILAANFTAALRIDFDKLIEPYEHPHNVHHSCEISWKSHIWHEIGKWFIGKMHQSSQRFGTSLPRV